MTRDNYRQTGQLRKFTLGNFDHEVYVGVGKVTHVMLLMSHAHYTTYHIFMKYLKEV